MRPIIYGSVWFGWSSRCCQPGWEAFRTGDFQKLGYYFVKIENARPGLVFPDEHSFFACESG